MKIEVIRISELPRKRVEQIVRLWCETFGDSERYVRHFLKSFPRDNACAYLAIEKGELCSMLFSLPVIMEDWNLNPKADIRKFEVREKFKNDMLYGRYIYAAVTLPKYRGRGFFSKLLEAAEKNAADFVTLIPADDSLYDFYARRGFDITLYSKFPFDCKLSELLKYGKTVDDPKAILLHKDHLVNSIFSHTYIKTPDLFYLSIEDLTVLHFEDRGYAVVKVENESSDNIKVYEMYSQSDEICGIINRYSDGKKRLGMLKMLGGKAAPHHLPEMTLFLQ